MALFERAAEAALEVVMGIGEGQWSEPTPCEDMDVLGVVEHMIAGLEQFAGVARGEAFDPGAQQSVTTEMAVDDYRDAIRAMVTAWLVPGVVGRDFEMPWGAIPGAALVEFMVVEEVVHGWDLARATGQSWVVDEDLAQAALDLARKYDDETIRVPGMFGPVVEVGVSHMPAPPTRPR